MAKRSKSNVNGVARHQSVSPSTKKDDDATYTNEQIQLDKKKRNKERKQEKKEKKRKEEERKKQKKEKKEMKEMQKKLKRQLSIRFQQGQGLSNLFSIKRNRVKNTKESMNEKPSASSESNENSPSSHTRTAKKHKAVEDNESVARNSSSSAIVNNNFQRKNDVIQTSGRKFSRQPSVKSVKGTTTSLNDDRMAIGATQQSPSRLQTASETETTNVLFFEKSPASLNAHLLEIRSITVYIKFYNLYKD